MSLAKQLLSSSYFMLATRFLQKGVGLISTLILARVLLPEDFGIVAFIAITTHLFYLLSETGSIQYIISKKEIDDDDLNTIWTLNIGLRSAFWLVLIFATPYITHYFKMAEAENALYVLSIIILLKALRNPGFVLYEKALNYRPYFKLEVSAKVLSFIVVMIWIVISPSYWAMVAGDITATLVAFIGSYLMQPFRPRPSLSKFKEQWGFSQWMFLRGILGFAKANLDQLFVSKLFSAEQLGGFYMAKDIVLLPANELIIPATDPLLASFSKSNSDKHNFSYQILFSLFVVSLIALPSAVYIYLLSPYIIHVFLSDKWLHISPIFSNFAVLMFFTCFASILNNICISTHRIKAIFYLDILTVVIIFSVLFAMKNSSIEAIALARGGIQCLITALFITYIKTFTHFSFLRLSYLLLPVILSIGITIYSMSVLITWLAETTLLHLLSLSIAYLLIFLVCYLFLYVIHYRHIAEYQHLKKMLILALEPITHRLTKTMP